MEIKDQLAKRPTENVMIVDALNLAFRWKHSGKLNFVTDYVSTVKSLAKSYNSGRVIIAADQGSSTFRKEIFPEYKGNRDKLKEGQTAAEAAEFKAFFNEYERTLDALAKEFEVFRYKGVEADDIAAWLVINKERHGFDTIWLISSDRDWDLLIDEGVSRFSYVTRKEITLETWDYPIDRHLYVSYKCLVGDTGDNIPGIPGVGPKRAAALIEEYGDAFDIYSACPIPGKHKYIQSLNEHKEQILTNYELMDLKTYCADAIGLSNVQDIEWRLNEKYCVADPI
jgi:DNA polymerase-1